MKTLRIGLLLISHGWGGAEETVYQLVKQYVKLNLNVSLFLNDEMVDCFADLKRLSIYRLGTTNCRNKLFILYSYFNMRRNLIKILKTQPFDLIHVHLGGSLQVYFGLVDKFKIPVLLNLHGSEIYNYYVRESLLDYWLIKKMLEKVKVIISPSQWQIQNLPNNFKSKTVIIHNGINNQEFKPLKVKKETKVILFVGRFIELKGISELIEVAKQLPHYRFWFAGCGPLAKLINLKNTDNLGFKNRKELIGLYNQATICCFPSHREAFGIAGLEAMACGRPVITTELGFSEFIENDKDGIIVEVKNTEMLRKTIVKLMENPQLRQQLGKNAREKALKLNWQEIAQKYSRIYKTTLTNCSN